MSTTARRYWLKVLRQLGVKNFRSTSGLGIPYICHVGDFSGEVPFYGSAHSAAEILVMAEWCRTEDGPVIFDVGANNGFIATQLTQLIADRAPRVYAFEPVPSTFAQLKLAVEDLGLTDVIEPICCAISDSSGITSLAFNPRESLFAQVRNNGMNSRVGNQRAMAATITLDQIVASLGVRPTLLKIDVEGFEPRVLAGAREVLSAEMKPAVCFEWNPLTFNEVGADPASMKDLLGDYTFFYVDDFEGQKRPFGEHLQRFDQLSHVCNIFAAPPHSPGRWLAVKEAALRALNRVTAS